MKNIVLLVVIAFFGFLLTRESEVSFLAKHPEYQYPKLSDYFQKLAQTKGPVYAFDVLGKAKLPANTDIHLLGHTIGDILYKQQGAGGMAICTNDFRNACSHTIVVGLFTDYGEKALDMIAQACYKAPGGKGAYTMCFHGLGHGILAQYGYDLKKAVESCQKTGTLQFENRESIECIGGAIMEITGGGFHDRDIWRRERVKYLSRDDPLAPCDKPIIPDNAKHMCYLYLTFNIIEPLKESYPTLTESDIKTAFERCNRIPQTETLNRDYCFGGVIKEFIPLLRKRDVRLLETLGKDELAKIYQACKLAPVEDGTISCIRHAVNTLYWGGENKPDTAIGFCNVISDKGQQDLCLSHVTGAVNFYKRN